MVEWELRLMFRRLILDEEIIRRRNDTFTSWLNAILSPHCIVNQVWRSLLL